MTYEIVKCKLNIYVLSLDYFHSLMFISDYQNWISKALKIVIRVSNYKLKQLLILVRQNMC